MAHRRSWANRLVSRLRFLLLFKGIRRLGQIGRTVFLADIFAYFLDRLGRHPGRIGTHVGDQTDQPFFPELHAFIQALRDHHGALHAETQLARGILLQLAGGEWRSRIAPPLLLFR